MIFENNCIYFAQTICFTKLLFFRAVIAGGGAPEIEIAVKLAQYAQTLTGVDAYCFKAFASALEVIPSTLAENAGLHPVATVTELRNKHSSVSIFQ